MTTTDKERYVDYLDFTSSNWKRPEGPTRIWRIIDGKRKTASGDVPKFFIQEVAEELEEDVVDFMIDNFITEEPLCVSRRLDKDSVAVRESRTLWRDILKQGVSVVALAVNSDSSMKPVIAGVNILDVVTAEDEENAWKTPIPFRTLVMRTIMGLQFGMVQESKVRQKYGVDKYLAAYGLSVHPSFRGQGLGDELLRARNDIGLAYQIPVTETIFTATVSQIIAFRNGFEVLAERKYTDFYDEEGNVAFPGIDVEFMKVMGKRLY